MAGSCSTGSRGRSTRPRPWTGAWPGSGTPLEAALSFDVTEEELLRRLAGRAAAQHRADDAEQTIRHRLEVFAIKTRPLIDYYAHRGLLINVDAIGPIEVVTKRILDDLDGNRRPG